MKNKFLFLFFIAFFIFGVGLNVFADESVNDEEATIVTGAYDVNKGGFTKSESDINKEQWIGKPETIKQKLFIYISIGIIIVNFIFFIMIIVGIVRDYNIPSILNKKE